MFHPTILLSGLTHPTFARYYLEVETLESFKGQAAIIQAKLRIGQESGSAFQSEETVPMEERSLKRSHESQAGGGESSSQYS